jgi:hypothetical protein
MKCIECLDTQLDHNPACRLVIINSLAVVRGSPDGRKGAYQQDYADMVPFRAPAARRNVALLVVHHPRKAAATHIMDAINGTTATGGACDYVMMLTRDRGVCLGQLTVTGRDIEKSGDFAITFDQGTCKWRFLGEAHAVKGETEHCAAGHDFCLSSAAPVACLPATRVMMRSRKPDLGSSPYQWSLAQNSGWAGSSSDPTAAAQHFESLRLCA